MRRRHHGRQFPIAEMRGEAERGFAVVQQLAEQRFVLALDASGIGMVLVVIPQPAQVDVLTGDTAQILPCVAQGGLAPQGLAVRAQGGLAPPRALAAHRLLQHHVGVVEVVVFQLAHHVGDVVGGPAHGRLLRPGTCLAIVGLSRRSERGPNTWRPGTSCAIIAVAAHHGPPRGTPYTPSNDPPQ